MFNPKRPRLQSGPGGLHIDLPPPDLSQFKQPANGPQPPQPQPQPQAAPPMAKPLEAEVKALFTALRAATVKGAEVVRYQTDQKRLGPNAKPQPPLKSLVVAFLEEREQLDNVCDLIEARIRHAMDLLLREAKQKKKKEAQEKALQEKTRMEGVEAEGQPAVVNGSTAGEGEQTEMAVDPTSSDAPATGVTAADAPGPSTAGPSTAIDALQSVALRRVSSTAPTVESLSTLPADTHQQSPAQDAAAKSRLDRRFSLKLDLSAPGLRGPFGEETNGEMGPPPASPVTLAPKTAKPRSDDMSGVLGMPGFEGAPPFSAHPNTAFPGNASFPLGVPPQLAMNALSGNLPDILSSMNPMQGALQPFPNLDQQPPPQEIIDLTQGSPSSNRMNIPINVDADTIDLTLDSPMIPLAQLVAAKNTTAEGGGGDAMEGLGLDAPKEEEGSDQQPKQGDTLDGLLSFVDGDSGPMEGIQSNNTTDILPSDATSLLATLTAAASVAAQNANAQPNDSLVDLNLDFGGDMAMYFNSDFGAGNGLGGGGGGEGSSFQDLGGFGDDTGAGGGMDFDSFLTGMGNGENQTS